MKHGPLDGILLAIGKGKMKGKMKEDEDEDEDESMDEQEKKETAMEEFLSAVEDEDAAGAVEALEALHDIFHSSME